MPKRWAVGAFMGLGLVVAGGPGPVEGAIHEVTACTDTTPGGAPGELRRLISDAAAGDTILLPPCVIQLTGAPGEHLNQEGDLDVTRDLTLVGAGPARTALVAAPGGRVLTADCSAHPRLTIAGLTVRGGRATEGGGLLVCGAVSLIQVVVTGNQAVGRAGGILLPFSSVLRLVETTVSGNQAGTEGGGVWFCCSGGPLSIERSTISGNQAGTDGGGLYLCCMEGLSLDRSTVSANLAGGQGGGVFIAGASSNLIVQSTVADNQATAGGGVMATGLSLDFRSSLLARNTPTNCQIVTASVISAGHNLQDVEGCPFDTATDVTAFDPGLGPLALNGGLTATQALLPGSPALDQGGSAGCLAPDQRGVGGPRDGGTGQVACDIGAFERREVTSAGRRPASRPGDPR